LRLALAKMHRWLAPGGRLFITADSPYMPGWSAIVPAYEAAKARGEEWPGFIPDFPKYTSRAGGGVATLNTLDPDILAREATRAGFMVERASFFPMERLGVQSGGREHAGCVARR
jgi:polyketide synthase PksJ